MQVTSALKRVFSTAGSALPLSVSVAAGKAARAAIRIRGGAGSAFPGLLVESMNPRFLARVLESLPGGVVVVSGTNGKTTTTKMVVQLLRDQGLNVFTNRSGSNFTRGVVASVLEKISFNGRLDADIAVLELDEAHAVHFVRAVNPRYSLLLNVMRDQLDRFGEIDTTAGMLGVIAENTTEGLVLNREDSRIAALAARSKAPQVSYFGLSERLRAQFPSDDDLHARNPLEQHGVGFSMEHTPSTEGTSTSLDSAEQEHHPLHPADSLPADVVLEELGHQEGTFTMGSQSLRTSLRINGVYNSFNAAAALALVRMIRSDDLDEQALVSSLSQVEPAFGRGESLTVNGQPVDLVLVKNPSGFRLGLSSFSAEGYATMIAINDNYADGRDMSWLWDVSFESLAQTSVAMVSGVRAYDMSLRLSYDEVPFTAIEPDLELALDTFLAVHPDQPRRIFCTYTAMLALRKQLGRYTEVEAFA